MRVIKAKEYEILRGVKSGGPSIPMARKPVRVATLMDEKDFLEDKVLKHNVNVFMEDRTHDWDWYNGQFRYFTRVIEVADVLVVYAVGDGQVVEPCDGSQSKHLLRQVAVKHAKNR